MLSSLGKVRKVRLRRIMVFVEALIYSTLAYVIVRFLPYRLWRTQLGKPLRLDEIPANLVAPDPRTYLSLYHIHWAHASLARRFGFFTCLMLGLSAKSMLRARGYESLVVLGVMRDRDGDNSSQNLGAHAWVISGGLEIAGGRSRKDFSAVAAYKN